MNLQESRGGRTCSTDRSRNQYEDTNDWGDSGTARWTWAEVLPNNLRWLEPARRTGG